MKRKLALLFLVVVLPPLALALFSTTRLVSGQLNHVLLKRSEDSLVVAKNLLHNVLGELDLKVQIMAQTRDIKEAVRTHDTIELIDKVHLANRNLKLNLYEAVTEIYDSNGVLIAAEPCTRLPLCPQPVIQETIRGSISSFRDIVEDKLRICSITPLHHEAAPTPIGAIALSFFVTQPFADDIKRIVGTEIILFTVRENGPLVLSSTFRHAGKPISLSLPDGIASQSVFDMNIGQTPFLFQISPLETGSTQIFLGTAIEKTVLTAVNDLIGRTLLQIGIIAVFFAVILALLFSRTLTGPIAILVDAAQQLGSGNLNHEVTLTSRDELSFLGHTFNIMRRKIREIIGQLKAAKAQLDRKVFDLSLRNLINQAIIFKKDTDLLDDLLGILRETMGAESAMLFVPEAGSDSFTRKALNGKGAEPLAGDSASASASSSSSSSASSSSSSSSSPLPLPQEIPAKWEIMQQTIQSGTPLYFNNLSATDGPQRTDFPEGFRHARNLLLLPLRGESGLQGVIHLLNKPQDFTPEDADLLKDIGDQIAIAMQKAELHQLAITDGLTGLFINRYFRLRLEAELTKAQRRNEPLALIMFDVDHFKKFNDTWGHQLGDQVLKLVAAILRTSVRTGIDLPARYGGEEFVVILPDTTGDGARQTAERIRTGIEQAALASGEQAIKVTISLGYSVFPHHATDKEALIMKADQALYRSKETGRNRTTAAE
jgi:diguanylate cyclase (GGDEF)-like protein